MTPEATETEAPAADFSEDVQDNSVEEITENNQENIEDTSASSEFANKDDEDKEPESEDKEDEGEEDPAADDEEEDKKKPESKNSLHSDEEYAELETKFNALNEKFDELNSEYEKLVEFKNNIEDKQKDELIEKFYMLSEEDKKDVLENKRNYSLEQIEEKLAVICFRKKVNFDLDTSSKNEDK